MRGRGVGTKKPFFAFVVGALAFMMIATAQADYRSLYGDGLWHDIGGGWYYAYNNSLDDGYWRYSGVIRFAFDYGGGQWWDYRTTWGTLGGSGHTTDTFIGDGTWHSLNNGWNFAYNKSLSDSYFNTGSATRFSYDYDGGRWWHYRTSWYTLGGTGVSQSFIGDGAWHNLNDGWSYAYNKGLNDAYWNTGSATRFSYDYDGGRWWHYRTSWFTLGASGVSQQFIGDGAYHSLSDGWSYAYNKAINDGYWNTGSAVRFVYDYDGGQWWHYRTSWATLGATGVSQSFVGDGAWHNLSDGWYYAYNKTLNDAYWNTGSATRFSYDYDVGQWWNHGDVGGWERLGPSGLSEAFIGDKSWHTMDSIWSYYYGDGIGSLRGSVSTWMPNQYGSGYWGSSPTLITCSYASAVLGLYDSGNTSSVYRYYYNGGSEYSCKWESWNYNISSKSEISYAVVFYTGSSVHDVSSWLSWLPVNPNPGCITRTETWDFRNMDWANRYNHEVRGFADRWVVQRAQGDYGNCGIIAAIDAFEARTGLYIGYTKYWMDVAINNGWSNSDGGTNYSTRDSLLEYMGTYYGVPMSAYCGTPSNYSLSDLLNFVNQGWQVILAVDLHYIPEFGSWPASEPANHAIMLVGSATIDGVYYAAITNGWSIQTNTPEIAGYSPTRAHPITYIPWSELQAAYYAYNRIY